MSKIPHSVRWVLFIPASIAGGLAGWIPAFALAVAWDAAGLPYIPGTVAVAMTAWSLVPFWILAKVPPLHGYAISLAAAVFSLILASVSVALMIRISAMGYPMLSDLAEHLLRIAVWASWALYCVYRIRSDRQTEHQIAAA